MATQSGVTYGINYIERNATGSTWGGAGCSSNATISGDGYVEFEAKTQTANVMMGLSFTSPNHHYNTIDYALYYITGDRLVVYESGSLKMTTTVSEGDLCRVMRVGNKIRYYRNSELLREVEETNPANMLADFTFYQSGARIYNPKIVDVAYQHGAQYIADVKSYSDYYAFGMLKPGRHGGESYRFTFNGMEKDDEVKGNGNHLDYGARILDPRIGKFLSLDPLAKDYPSLSDYAYVANNPIMYIDPDGKKIVIPNVADREPILKMINSRAAGVFGINDKTGELYVIKKEGSKGYSEYYRDKLIEGIEVKDKTVTIVIDKTPNVPTGIAADGKTIEYDKSKTSDLDKTSGGGTTYGAEGTNADVFISGNEYKGLKDTEGKPLEDKPADILMHEVVTHGVPIITGNDQGNAVEEENKVRAQYKEGKNQLRAPESTAKHPLCKGCKP
jgi:RHS repeat-associated protein